MRTFCSPISPSRWEAFGKHFNIETSKDDMRSCAFTWQGWLSATDGEEQPWTGRPEPPPGISKYSTILYHTCISYGPNLNQYQSYQSSNMRQDPRHPEPAVASLSIFQVSQFLPSSLGRSQWWKRDGNNLPWMHHSIQQGSWEASAKSPGQG